MNQKSRCVSFLVAVSLLQGQTGHTWTETETHRTRIGNSNLEVKDLSQSERVQICDAIARQWQAQGAPDTSLANARKIIMSFEATEVKAFDRQK